MTIKSSPYRPFMKRCIARVFPPHCIICFTDLAAGKGICDLCKHFLPRPINVCPVCDLKMPHTTLCGRCRNRRPDFEQVVAAFRYQPPLVARIHDIKFSGKIELLESAGFCLANEVERRNRQADYLVPVPLHHQRLKERGFDQATELARIVARQLGLPMLNRMLFRQRPTAPQTTLSVKERSDNLRGAFATTRKLDGQRIALIDDVMTTGATCHHAARCLRRAGADHVEVWILART